MAENQYNDKKSLKFFLGKNIDWKSLAKDCVCFANARGGIIAIGIEDSDTEPAYNQVIPKELSDKIRKRISELTINVAIYTTVEKSKNEGEWIKIKILPSASTIASTTDGQYYIRISDQCKPVLPDELSRLIIDKPAFIWETKVVQKIKFNDCDKEKLKNFINDIYQSTRVSDFVKQKSTEELLTFYQLIEGGWLTNLGILWLGKREQRARQLYAPVIQFLKYDEKGNKVNKKVWDDFSFNPKELIEDIWQSIPEWKKIQKIFY